ncbi:MAG: hypothetical protein HZB39_17120 [Planctomycetes bacterium]|nr:hypothetical protein [Planctomycetota bacterium]
MNAPQNPTPTTARKDGPFSTQTTMAEVLRRDASLRMVLMRFHIGGCSHCGFDQNDSIEQVATDNGVPVADLLGALNSSVR